MIFLPAAATSHHVTTLQNGRGKRRQYRRVRFATTPRRPVAVTVARTTEGYSAVRAISLPDLSASSCAPNHGAQVLAAPELPRLPGRPSTFNPRT